MSIYTNQLRYYIEKWSEDNDLLSLDQKIQVGRTHLFDFNYPIFDANYKQTLETNFINQYYVKEIGLETFALFKHFLKTKFNLRMPYYNQLYESALLEIKPFVNIDYKEQLQKTGKKDSVIDLANGLTAHNTGGGTNNGTTGNDTTQTTNDTSLESDLPQANYAGLDYGTNQTQNNGSIITNVTGTNSSTITQSSDSTQNTTNTGTTTDNTTEDYVLTKLGSVGLSQPEQVIKLRETFLAIDEMVLNECKGLFMTIYHL